MEINKKTQNGVLTFEIKGRLDTNTSPGFQEALIPAFEESKEIILDLADLVYISSAGLRVILLGEKTAQASKAVMKLINVSSAVREVLDMTGFTDILTIE